VDQKAGLPAVAWSVLGRPAFAWAPARSLQPSISALLHAKAGAGDEARTRDVHLGKVVLYQLSYTRSFERDNNVQRTAARNLLIALKCSRLLNPNESFPASYDQTLMKKLFLLCMFSLGLYGIVFPQSPTQTPIPSPTAATAVAAATAATSLATPVATTAPSVAPGTASSDLADKIHQKLQKKLGHKHGITIDVDDKDTGHIGASKDIPAEIIPLVGIVFLSIFGAPVLIVILIGMFALLVSRSRQRTIRMLVEKGQPVPAELLAPATRSVRQRSDVRRGVVWTMVGLGIMIFFGAVNNWEGGVWSLGLIPFLIGIGYLLIWKLEGKKDIPPPPPAP
jgi:Domain of unknown function (DUF6249)